MQILSSRCTTKIVAFTDPWLPIVEFYAHYCYLHYCKRKNGFSLKAWEYLVSLMHWFFACLQVTYRLFELTNTLKIAFVPSKDDKRLLHNLITAAIIFGVLYSLSYIFLRVPQMVGFISFKHLRIPFFPFLFWRFWRFWLGKISVMWFIWLFSWPIICRSDNIECKNIRPQASASAFCPADVETIFWGKSFHVHTRQTVKWIHWWFH